MAGSQQCVMWAEREPRGGEVTHDDMERTEIRPMTVSLNPAPPATEIALTNHNAG